MSTYDVSVICLVYNADVNKLLTTLKSIIYQENCNFEIIVADDGSKNNYKELIEKYFRKNNFVNYKLVLNTKNCGIVKNLISGLDVASGKYVKQISPGDYLFNQYTLSRVFDFAEKNSANLLFGDAVFYTYDNNELNILPRKAPWFSEIYTNDMNYDYNKIIKYQLYYKDYILGAAMFYRKDLLCKYLGLMKNNIVYLEDSVIKIFALNKHKIYFYKDFIIWYESNSGISTNKKKGFTDKINIDNFNFYKLIKNVKSFYVKKAYYDTYFDLSKSNKFLRVIYRLLNSLLIDRRIFKIKKKKKEEKIKSEIFDINRTIFYNWLIVK